MSSWDRNGGALQTGSLEVGAAGCTSPRGEALLADTLFDLASVTKPVVSAMVMRLAEAGRLHLQAPLESLLAAARDTPAGRCDPGAPALPSGGTGGSSRILRRPARQTRLAAQCNALRRRPGTAADDCRGPIPPEGFPPLYSDLGYLLVGAAVSETLGVALDTLLDENSLQASRLGDRLSATMAPSRAPRACTLLQQPK